jgi:Domain of Unknown Function (DUF326)
MIRLLAILCALGIATTLTLAAPPAPDSKLPKDTCVKSCNECAKECLACMKHCRENKMEEMARECDICHHACLLCANAVGSKNPQAWLCCELCEKICSDCAAQSDKSTDPHMKECAEACRHCAKACAEARK